MSTTERDIELVNDSLERCDSQGEFLDAFYRRFFAASSEIADKFKNTDLRRQKRMLRESFYVLLLAYGGDEAAWSLLEERAVRHSRTGLDVEPRLYNIWLDCLIETVREFDTRADGNTVRAWRRVMDKGIAFMAERY